MPDMIIHHPYRKICDAAKLCLIDDMFFVKAGANKFPRETQTETCSLRDIRSRCQHSVSKAGATQNRHTVKHVELKRENHQHKVYFRVAECWNLSSVLETKG